MGLVHHLGPSSSTLFLHFTWREPPKLLGPFRSLSDSDHCPIKHFSEIEQHNGYLYLPHENYRLPYHPGWRFYLSTTREPPRMPWPGPFQARLRSRDVSPGRCVKHGAQNMWLLCLICMANGPKFFMMCIKKKRRQIWWFTSMIGNYGLHRLLCLVSWLVLDHPFLRVNDLTHIHGSTNPKNGHPEL